MSKRRVKVALTEARQTHRPTDTLLTLSHIIPPPSLHVFAEISPPAAHPFLPLSLAFFLFEVLTRIPLISPPQTGRKY